MCKDCTEFLTPQKKDSNPTVANAIEHLAKATQNLASAILDIDGTLTVHLGAEREGHMWENLSTSLRDGIRNGLADVSTMKERAVS